MSNTIPQGWSFEKVGKLILEFSQKCSVENEHEVLTSSKSGLMRQSDYYGENRITRRSTIGFNVIPQNYITYRSRSDNNRFTFNQNNLGFKGLISKYYPVFTHSEGELYNNFLLNLFNFYSGEFALESVGTSQLVLSINAVKSVRLPFPPLPEQQKIATILSSVDDVIEKTRAQIDKLKDLKTGMMQELWTKGVGSDGVPHTEFKDSPVGRIPVGWDALPLEHLVSPDRNITYGIVQAGPHNENGVPYIRVSDMTRRSLSLDGMLRTSPEIAQKYKRSAVSTGDIIYALRGVIGHVHLVPPELEGANLTQGTARISPINSIHSRYLLWAMKSPSVKLQNDLEAKGSTFKEVTLASLRKIQITLPPLEEQEKIASVMDGVEQNLYSSEDKLKHLQSLKSALMQDLLTGKVRVKTDQKESAVA